MLEFIHMNDELVPSRKCFITHFADVRLLTGMDAHVDGEFILASQRFAAYGTFKRFIRSRCYNIHNNKR